MKLRFLVFVLALGLITGAARGQLGVTFTGGASRISNSKADSGPFAFLGQNGTAQIFGGVTIGAYYDFLHSPRFDIGADLRDRIEHGQSASINSFLGGVRLVAKPQNSRFRPYLELAVGDGRTRSALSPARVSKLEVDGFLGTDFKLKKHVDWRALEIGYGSVTTISSSIYGGPVSIPAAKLLSFSSGFVFRF